MRGSLHHVPAVTGRARAPPLAREGDDEPLRARNGGVHGGRCLRSSRPCRRVIAAHGSRTRSMPGGMRPCGKSWPRGCMPWHRRGRLPCLPRRTHSRRKSSRLTEPGEALLDRGWHVPGMWLASHLLEQGPSRTRLSSGPVKARHACKICITAAAPARAASGSRSDRGWNRGTIDRAAPPASVTAA